LQTFGERFDILKMLLTGAGMDTGKSAKNDLHQFPPYENMLVYWRDVAAELNLNINTITFYISNMVREAVLYRE